MSTVVETPYIPEMIMLILPRSRAEVVAMATLQTALKHSLMLRVEALTSNHKPCEPPRRKHHSFSHHTCITKRTSLPACWIQRDTRVHLATLCNVNTTREAVIWMVIVSQLVDKPFPSRAGVVELQQLPLRLFSGSASISRKNRWSRPWES